MESDQGNFQEDSVFPDNGEAAIYGPAAVRAAGLERKSGSPHAPDTSQFLSIAESAESIAKQVQLLYNPDESQCGAHAATHLEPCFSNAPPRSFSYFHANISSLSPKVHTYIFSLPRYS